MAEHPLHDHDSGEGLLSVEQARADVLSQVSPLAPLQLPLAEAAGCVLAEDVVATGELPPFASSAMDGYAVRAVDVAGAALTHPVELKVVGQAMIGRRPEGTVGAGEAMAIATGAPIPGGADAVVPIENAEVADDLVRLFHGAAPGAHVRPAGEDVSVGTRLAPAGRRLGAPELGLLASAGVSHPVVYPRPRVIVMSTGDELVTPTEEPAFGQIRDANAYTIFAALKDAGATPVLAGIVRDDVDQLRDVVFSHLSQADAFVSSGGVSVGVRDVVKAAFFRRGDVRFFRVAMQPGMPQGFGHVEGKPYFGLPGNPVSVFVSFEMFVRPAILRMLGRSELDRPEVTATLTAEVRGPKGKLQLARVEVRRGADGWEATPTGGRGSNLLSTVARANGLAMVPAGTEVAPAGSQVQVRLFRAAVD